MLNKIKQPEINEILVRKHIQIHIYTQRKVLYFAGIIEKQYLLYTHNIQESLYSILFDVFTLAFIPEKINF